MAEGSTGGGGSILWGWRFYRVINVFDMQIEMDGVVMY